MKASILKLKNPKEMSRKVVSTEIIGDVELIAESDVYEREVWDTKIILEGYTLCWVTGEDKKHFIMELKRLVEDYRI